ncbi:hypothetical protein [Streptomyces sp. NBC_00212]|uniref:hypothetical protein n=1 Tax=Streptomyces sp. NBC_00212 TaxID=2975684 RepID=UPI003253EEC8
MQFSRRTAVGAAVGVAVAGALAVPALCTGPALAAASASAEQPHPVSRAAEQADPALDVVAVSIAAVASAGGLLYARRRPR